MSTPRLSEEQLAALEHRIEVVAGDACSGWRRDAPEFYPVVADLVADLRSAQAEMDALRHHVGDVRVLLSSEQAARDALRVDRDECLRLLSEERRAKDHAETEAAVLRARLEKAREALTIYADEHMGHSMECTTHACRSCCCGLDDLRAALGGETT